MTNRRAFYVVISLLASMVLGVGAVAWLQGLRGEIGIYKLFPLLGILAWLLMWTHYVGGSLKRYLGLANDRSVMQHYAAVTGYIVLCLILLHPGLLYIGLFRDGLGLPPYSAFEAYQTIGMRVGVVLGSVGLMVVLLFELGRWFRHKGWWRYIEWANIAAMGIIFMHGLLIGGGITGWFRIVWIALGVILVATIAYNWYYDKYITNGALENGRD